MSGTRKLGFESLESRRVCAGDVSVSVVNGELKIVGDDLANFVDVQLRTVQGTKQFVVTGKPFNGNFTSAGDPVATGVATTINGSSAPFIGAATKVAVAMKEGNDAITAGGDGAEFLVTGLKISMGTGSDYLKLKTFRNSSTLAAAIQMTAVGGADGQVEAGNDKLVLDGINSPQAGASIFLGGGNDRVFVSNVNAKGTGTAITTDAGGGGDTIAIANAALFNVTFNGGSGSDRFSAAGCSFNDVTFNGGEGNDDVIAQSCQFHDVIINAGTGADDVSVNKVSLNKVTANMGASVHRDTMTISNFSANIANIDLGAGNGDLLNLVTEIIIRERTVLNGGAGTGDELRIGNRQRVGANNRTITLFEIKPPGL